MKNVVPNVKAASVIKSKIVLLSVLAGLVFFFAPAKTHAQTIDSSWVKYADTSGVSVYYDTVQCSGTRMLFVNFYNKDSFDVKIQWQDSIKIEGMWIGIAPNGNKTLTVGKGSVTSFSCSATSNKDCAIKASDWFSVPNLKITDYKIAAITITKQ